MSFVEQYRKECIEVFFENTNNLKCFGIWKKEIKKRIGTKITADKLIDLGDELRDIFLKTGKKGRTQKIIVDAGNLWEFIVCWYLNLCLIGSNTVVTKNKKYLIPNCIRDCLTVKYGSTHTNTESDLLAITFPNKITKFKYPFSKINLEHFICDKLNEIEVNNIQCKTNWKDNVQIPMLWDIVYSSKGFKSRKIKIGQNAHTIKDLKDFMYTFVTVPTNDDALNYHSTQMPVIRINNLSGGNYWGRKTKTGIANSIKEIFTNCFSYGTIRKSLREDINSQIGKIKKQYKYFRI